MTGCDCAAELQAFEESFAASWLLGYLIGFAIVSAALLIYWLATR
jgi:hypothetical protein